MAAPLPSLPELESLVARLTSPEQLPPQALSELLQDTDRLLSGLQTLPRLDLEADEAFLRGAAGCCTTLASFTLPPWAEAPSSSELQGPEGLQGLASLCWRAAAASSLAATLLHPLENKALCERLGTSLAYRLASASSVAFVPAATAVHLLQQAAACLPQSAQQRCASGLEALLEAVLAAASGALAFFAVHHESRLGAALRSTVFKLPVLHKFLYDATEVLSHIEQTSGHASHNSRIWRALRTIHFSVRKGNLGLPESNLTIGHTSASLELVMKRRELLLRELAQRGMRPDACWCQRWGDMAYVLVVHIVAPYNELTVPNIGAALLGLLPHLRSEPLGGRCCLTMLELLSKELVKQGRSAGTLPTSQLLSLLEAGTLCAAGTMALLEATRQGGTGADAEDVGFLADCSLAGFTAWAADMRGLLEPNILGLRKGVCETLRRELQAAHVPAAAVEAAEAAIRLAGRLFEEGPGKLSKLLTLVTAAGFLLDVGHFLKGNDTAYLQASSSAAKSAAKLILKMHGAPPAEQAASGAAIHPDGDHGSCLSALLKMATAAAWIDVRAPAPLNIEDVRRQNDELLVTIMPAVRALSHCSGPGQASSSSSTGARRAGAASSVYWCWFDLVWIDATLKNQGAEACMLDGLGWSEVLAATCLAYDPVVANDASSVRLEFGTAFEALAIAIAPSPRFGAMLAACGYFEGLIKWAQQVVTGMSKRQAAKALGERALAELRDLVVMTCQTMNFEARTPASPEVEAWWKVWSRFRQMPVDQLHSKHVWKGLVGRELLPPVLAWAKDLEAARQSSMQHDQQRVQERATAALQLRRCAFLGCTNMAGCSEGRLPVRRCGGCGQVTFCSRQCQLAAWGEHSKACKAGGA